MSERVVAGPLPLVVPPMLLEHRTNRVVGFVASRPTFVRRVRTSTTEQRSADVGKHRKWRGEQPPKA